MQINNQLDGGQGFANQAAAAAVAGLSKFARLRLLLVGDSRGARNVPTPGFGYQAFFNVANSVIGNVFDVIPRDASNGTFAVSGASPSSLLSGTPSVVDQAVATSADYALVFAGINAFPLTSHDAAAVAADLVTIWSRLIASGKTVIACTEPPNDTYPLDVAALNKLIRKYAATTKNLILCDWANELYDASANTMRADSFIDDRHFSGLGDYLLGVRLATQLQKIQFGSNPFLPSIASDALTPNPMMSGTGLATSLIQWGSGSAVETTTARSTQLGQWQKIVVTSNAATPRFYAFSVALAAGTKVRATCDIKATVAGWGFASVKLYVFKGDYSGGLCFAGDDINGAQPAYDRTLVTDPVLTVGTSAMAVLEVIGNGTVEFGRLALVADPN